MDPKVTITPNVDNDRKFMSGLYEEEKKKKQKDQAFSEVGPAVPDGNGEKLEYFTE